MTDDVSKLPAWPERKRGQLLVNYNHDLADAALARMEALVKVVREYVNILDYRGIPHDLDALLAACEREEGR
jgi:hypothetical protein